MESRGYTDEPNQKKAVDELVLSYAAEANDPKDAASSEDGIGKESGDIENNNYGSKKGSRGISNRGGRGGKNCGHFNNNQGGHGGQDGECSNNSRGGRGGQGRGHINNNWGGRGGKGRGHIDNKRGGHRGHSNNNQGDCRGTGSGCSKNQGGRGRGGLDDGCFNSNKGHSGGIDNGYFNNGSEAADYNSKNAKSESASSCTTNATETKEALDAHAIQQGRQANTEVKAQPQVGDPSGGSILIKNLDKAIDDRALHAIFSAFGNILSCKVETDASGQSKGYGHIEYDSEEAAQEAIEKVNSTEEAAQEAIEKVNGTLLNHKKVYAGPLVSKQERAEARDMTKSTKVYVANLSESTTKEDLREVFCYFGKIASTVVVRDEDGKSKCFGFVNFKDADDASWSIEVLNGHKFDNKEWCVRRAQKKSVKRAQE
nr:polyadenylate-binding protein 8-like [Ipomoea batatas]